MNVIAIPIFGKRVSARLDCAERFLLVTLENGVILNRKEIHLLEYSPMEKVLVLIHAGTEVLVCGGLTKSCEEMLRGTGIRVIPWIRGEVDEVLSMLLDGKPLPTDDLRGSRKQMENNENQTQGG